MACLCFTLQGRAEGWDEVGLSSGSTTLHSTALILEENIEKDIDAEIRHAQPSCLQYMVGWSGHVSGFFLLLLLRVIRNWP
jgi:hypothetical protein